MDGEQVLTFYWIDPIDAADRMVARPEFADHFYFHYERQESEQRPGKRAFGRANSGIVFQQAQLLDMFIVPMLHLFYGDKSFSGAHRGHYPMYGKDDRKYAKYVFLHVICNHDTNMHLYINYNKHIIIMKAISFPENLLNVHEDLRRKTWFPVAWMPIYDPNRSKRPTQGYQCDAARQMRLFHVKFMIAGVNCWAVGTKRLKRLVSLYSPTKPGTRFAPSWADCWVISRCGQSVYYCIFCLILHFHAYHPLVAYFPYT